MARFTEAVSGLGLFPLVLWPKMRGSLRVIRTQHQVCRPLEHEADEGDDVESGKS